MTGDWPFDVDHGIKLTGNINVIKNCNVGFFCYGIWLDSSNFNAIKQNGLYWNGYTGLALAKSNNNNITSNIISFNVYGLAMLSSNNTIVDSNKVCANLNADIWQEASTGNSGTNNTCYNTHSWNDTGAVDCTHLCCLRARYAFGEMSCDYKDIRFWGKNRDDS